MSAVAEAHARAAARKHLFPALAICCITRAPLDIGRYNCTLCPAGSYSESRAGSCLLCDPGKFNAESMQAACTECDAGRHQPDVGETDCIDCPKGTYRAGTGFKNCLECSRGKYANAIKSFGCKYCETGSTSEVGAEACLRASRLYYLPENILALSEKDRRNSTTTAKCPDNAVCNGGLYAPVPKRGYWVDRRGGYEFAGAIYECARNTCRGGKFKNATGNASCWHQAAYGDSLDNPDDDGGCRDAGLLCTEGANGPLCGTCEFGYLFSGSSRNCVSCDRAQAQAFYIVGAMAVGAMAAAFIIVFEIKFTFIEDLTIFQLVMSADPGVYKVVWTTYQIIAGTAMNLDIKFPSPFSDVLGLLNFFSFDFLSVECFMKSKDRYYSTVWLYSITPLFASLVILVLCFFRLFKVASINGDVSAANRIKSEHLWVFLFLTYMVLPPVAMKQLQSLDCITMPHDGARYLRVDTAINCESEAYTTFRSSNLVFVAIYQIVPAIWLYLLWKKRGDLNPAVSKADAKLAVYVRDKDVSLNSLRFLFESYRCNAWWFEVFEVSPFQNLSRTLHTWSSSSCALLLTPNSDLPPHHLYFGHSTGIARTGNASVPGLCPVDLFFGSFSRTGALHHQVHEFPRICGADRHFPGVLHGPWPRDRHCHDLWPRRFRHGMLAHIHALQHPGAEMPSL